MKWGRWSAAAGLCVAAMICSSCQTWLGCEGREGCGDACEAMPGRHAMVCEEPTMMAMAQDLDWIQCRIDEYGSVTAKAPDVWGQARLTKFREEFERQMAPLVSNFEFQFQAQQSRADQAAFTSSLALSAAIRGGGTPPTITNEKVEEQEESKLVDNAKSLIKTKTEAKTAAPLAFDKGGSIHLELTELMDQHARYIRHNQQLRRINEGDDTSDSAGYALHLVRIPVSLLPGRKTDVGYGAEIMFTIRQELGDDLLPSTFRNLVTNDIMDQLAPGLTMTLNDKNVRDSFKEEEESLKRAKKVQLELESKQKQVNQLKEMARKGTPLTFEYIVTAPTQIASSTIQYVAAFNQQSMIETKLTEAERAKEQALVQPRKEVAKTINVSLTSTTKLRRAGLPYPSSQIKDILGADEITNIVKHAYQNLFKDHDLVHLTDVQAFLQEEVSGAYRILQAKPDLWDVIQSPHFIEIIRTRKVDEIKKERDRCISSIRCQAENQTAAYLAWAILVDSALLNEELHRDMREVATLKGAGQLLGDVKHPLYLPGELLSPDAKLTFNHYVQTRWPVHVFALDPEVQEQNIQDSLSLRRELQLAASLAFVSGRMSARNFTSFARRIEAEFQTVALNRTCVGFAHGPNTFGWRFYPRFQTPDIEPNTTVLFRDLLWGGPSKRALMRQHRLEPGPRECVALVIMPSFVPYATLDVSSNWFRLTNPRHKEFTMQDAMRVSRVVKALQTCSTAVTDDVCYRDGDKYRMLARARQLSERLPLQTMNFQVPYTNTLGGFEMFNSGTSDLAPELYGWYGEPGINPEGDTVLFLMGDHFSVHQTRVIAGGFEIRNPDPKYDTNGKILPADSAPVIELLSRQVMKVRIPKGVHTLKEPGSNEKKNDVVDLHIATPYGVSPHLHIPVFVPKKSKEAEKPAGAASAAEGYKFKSNKFVLNAQVKTQDGKLFLIEKLAFADKTRPVLEFNDALGTAPKELELKIGYKLTPAIQGQTLTLSYAEDAKAYAMQESRWGQYLTELTSRLNALGAFAADQFPWGKGLATETIVIYPNDNQRATKEVKLAEPLQFEFKIVTIP